MTDLETLLRNEFDEAARSVPDSGDPWQSLRRRLARRRAVLVGAAAAALLVAVAIVVPLTRHPAPTPPAALPEPSNTTAPQVVDHDHPLVVASAGGLNAWVYESGRRDICVVTTNSTAVCPPDVTDDVSGHNPVRVRVIGTPDGPFAHLLLFIVDRGVHDLAVQRGDGTAVTLRLAGTTPQRQYWLAVFGGSTAASVTAGSMRTGRSSAPSRRFSPMSERPTALITGASRGIGAALAEALSGTHDVLLGGRDVATLDTLAARLPGARPWPVELTDPAALAAATAGIHRLDVLVHSAGVARVLPLADTSVDVWRQAMEVNVVAVAELTRLLLPALRAARGHVVLINSGAGLRANPGWGAYAASKFALRAYADVLRAEEDAHGLRVTSVHPGRTDTDMQRGVRSDEGGEYQAEQYLRPESVAQAVLTAVMAPPDAHLTELVVRPGRR